MTEELSKEIFNILTECRNRGMVSRHKGLSTLTRQAINESEARNWLYAHRSYSLKLTKEGVSVLDAGSVDTYLNDLLLERDRVSQSVNHIQADNVIYGNNSGNIIQSTDQINSTDSQLIKNNSIYPEKNAGKSLLSIFSIVVGSIAALIAIYKFIIEDLIK